MNVNFLSNDSVIGRWQQRGVDHLRQVLRHLQQLLAVDRHPEALALIPIRAVQPRVARERHRRTWRD
ncbi:MAG: hypothetical protein WB775_13560 [Burkholderiaceae bacterium]